MRLLLDSHVALWILDADARLGPACRATIGDADDVLFSAVTAWESNIKRSNGKLTIGDGIGSVLTAEGYTELPISSIHGERAGRLPLHHRDPFDRVLVAQAQLEQLTLVTADGAISAYDVTVLDPRR